MGTAIVLQDKRDYHHLHSHWTCISLDRAYCEDSQSNLSSDNVPLQACRYHWVWDGLRKSTGPGNLYERSLHNNDRQRQIETPQGCLDCRRKVF